MQGVKSSFDGVITNEEAVVDYFVKEKYINRVFIVYYFNVVDAGLYVIEDQIGSWSWKRTHQWMLFV